MQPQTPLAGAHPQGKRWTTRAMGIVALPLLLLAVTAGVFVLRPAPHAAHAAALTGLRVQGNQLQDAAGHPVQLRGVNRSGSEYACIQGWGIFDGPSDAASVQAMASWGVQSVRVPLNEDCWLGINGVNAAYAGSAYQNAIVSYVNLLHANGMYAELTLMWVAPGTQQATFSNQAPDSDHSPAFWSSVASVFKNDPLSFFGLLNEPHGVTAACWRDGGSACSGQVPYSVAGAQTLINAIRATGATNVIADQCVDYANDCSQWLTYKPSDPAGQLIAEAHVYGKNTCDTTSCFDKTMAPVAAAVPLLFGELGETYDGSDCNNSTSFTSAFMTWADAHAVGYQAWTWDTWGTCNLSLITSYNGTPAGAYGTYVQHHLQALAGSGGGGGGSGTPTPAPTATTAPSPTPSSSPSSSPSPSPSPPPGGSCAPPSITFGAQSASPSAGVMPGQPIAFASSFASSCATTGLVDFEVFTSGGTRVWQTWQDNYQMTGQSQTFHATWQVPASQPLGSYYLSVGIFSPGWTKLWAWKHQAVIFGVLGTAPACSGAATIHFVGAAATPSSVAPGATVRLSVTFSASCATTGLVDFEVYDSAGKLAYQTWRDNRSLTGQQQTFTVRWKVPSGLAPGMYYLSIGVFSPGSTGWSTLYGWDQAAAQLSVQ